MKAQWKTGRYKPEIILNNISKSRSVSNDGTVSFTGFGLEEHIPVLASMLEFPKAAKHINRSSIIWAALATKGELNRDEFLSSVNDAIRRKLSVKSQKYFLLTSLSISGESFPNSIRVLGSVLRLAPARNSKRWRSRQRLVEAHPVDIPNTPHNYLQIAVEVEAGQEDSAAKQALASVDLLRGIICLFANPGMQWTFGSSTHRPINVVRSGGKHTLHLPDGSAATTGLWYEPSFRPAPIYEHKEPQKLFKVVRRVIRMMQASRYCDELADAATAYARSFDESDSNVAFIRLWSALESLLIPGSQKNYDVLVRRCSFLYTEKNYHKQVLEHLRDYRNSSVHSGLNQEDGRTSCFQVQEYFKTAFLFYVRNAKFFGSIEDVNFFLDLPADSELLKLRIRSLRKAVRFMAG